MHVKLRNPQRVDRWVELEHVMATGAKQGRECKPLNWLSKRGAFCPQGQRILAIVEPAEASA